MRLMWKVKAELRGKEACAQQQVGARELTSSHNERRFEC